MPHVLHLATRRMGMILSTFVLALAMSAQPVRASSVLPMNLPALADHAGQVIVGRVSSVRSYWVEDPRQILSEVTLTQVEYLKGARAEPDDTFTLIVPGGTVGGMQMRLHGAPTFAVGQRWLLCLLPSYKTFPVVGIWQGAFHLVPDSEGIERVYQHIHQTPLPVTAINEEGFVRISRPRNSLAHAQVVGGTNTKVTVSPLRRDSAGAMSYDQLLDRLGPILEQSRGHHLTRPAGQRVPVRYRSVPLQPSPNSPVADQSSGPATPVLRSQHTVRQGKQAFPQTTTGEREVRP